MATEFFSWCILTVLVNNGLAYDWRNIVKNMLQKMEANGK